MVENAKNVFLNLLNKPEDLKKNDFKILSNIIENYPYFAPAKILQLLLSKKFKSFEYNKILKSTAVLTSDRKHLYNIMNDNILNYEEKESLINEIGKETLSQEVSFLEWIAQTKPTPYNFKNPNKVKAADNFNLNDIKAKKHDNKIIIRKKDYMTETLAKLYVEQGKYKDAIRAYKILCLKYPEKISLFADQIKIIKKQIKSS